MWFLLDYSGNQHIFHLDSHVLQSLATRMKNGEMVQPTNDNERECFQLIKDLDHIGGHVQGSLTNKKYMRNEIWSLVSYKGACSWYITLSPADKQHPISLYYADEQRVFKPFINDDRIRHLLESKNPVAGARFFHLMVQSFIQHVLGVPEGTIDGSFRKSHKPRYS
ncbi:hypothetical protein BV22DRAFT_1022574 [Leucogyrophana mollusca]|uniref:Uncharacterized protein n=1 Tax=Leucogyrophana mollusca TaxID=85980 RepID=A0ACB8B215_9AGAM|nr:hypothetical protein BV22DRAFT_1022574 [Leucogyrophana mollusca]